MDVIDFTVLEMLKELLLITEPIKDQLSETDRQRWIDIFEATSHIREPDEDETSS